MSQNNETAAMLLSQQVESWTLFLCWELNSFMLGELFYAGSWTLFLCKRFLLFQEICIDAGHMSENTLLVYHLATGVRKKGQATKYVNSTLSSAKAPARIIYCCPRFARLAALPLPRACTALTKSDEKERLLAVYSLRFIYSIPEFPRTEWRVPTFTLWPLSAVNMAFLTF